MKFKPENHIIGKVYDLSQYNMNALIAVFESQAAEIETIKEMAEDLPRVLKENAQLRAELEACRKSQTDIANAAAAMERRYQADLQSSRDQVLDLRKAIVDYSPPSGDGECYHCGAFVFLGPLKIAVVPLDHKSHKENCDWRVLQESALSPDGRPSEMPAGERIFKLQRENVQLEEAATRIANAIDRCVMLWDKNQDVHRGMLLETECRAALAAYRKASVSSRSSASPLDHEDPHEPK